MPLLGTFINLPSDLATSTLSISGGLLSDLSPAWGLILGVIIFGALVAFLIGSFRHH